MSSEPEAIADNLARIQAIYAEVNLHGIREEELTLAQNKVASRVVLRSERPTGRLSSLGGNWIYREEYRSVGDDLATLRGITCRDVRELLDIYPLGATTTVAVGPLESL